MCDDFVWDPTLEELRMRKFGTGSFSGEALVQQSGFPLDFIFVLTLHLQLGNESMTSYSQILRKIQDLYQQIQ